MAALVACGSYEEQIDPLPLGATLTGGLPTLDSVRDFIVDLRAGEALRIDIEQIDLDLVLELRPPGGGATIRVDNWAQSWGTESLCAVARLSGHYRIRLKSGGIAPRGRFRLRAWVRASTPEDRICAAATRAQADAFALTSSARPADEITRAFEAAAALWRRQGAAYPEALIWQRLAALHKRRGEVQEEIASLTAARRLLAGEADHLIEWSQITADLSHALLRRGDAAAAEVAAQQGLASATSGDPVAEAFARLGRAQVLQVKGDPFAAASDLEAALEVFESRRVIRNQANTLTRQAVLYGEELGLFEEAVDLADAALTLWKQLGDRGSQGSALIAKGWALYRLGELQAAVGVYDAALELTGGRGAVGLAAFDRKGGILADLGDRAEAEAAYRAALDLTDEADRRNQGQIFANLGWLKIDASQWQSANADLTRALDLLSTSGDLDALAHVRVGLGRYARAQGDIDAALGHFKVADDHLDALRRTALEHGGRMPVDPVWQSYADESVDLRVEVFQRSGKSDDLAAAFEAAELARARNFLSILLESDIEPRAHAAPELAAEEQRLNSVYDDLDLRRQALEAKPGPSPELADVERRQRGIQLQLKRLRQQIRVSHPRFAELTTPDRPELSRIQRSIPTETRILAYALGPRRSFLFLVGPSSLELFELPARAWIEDRVRRARASLSNRGRLAHAQRTFILRQLADTLLSPVAQRLHGIEHLIVVASGELGLLPFAPLPFPDDSASSDPTGSLFTLSYFPSAATIDVLDSRQSFVTSGTRSLILVADPVFKRSDPRLVERIGGGDGSEQGGEDRLESTLREARGILELFPDGRAVAATGFNARRDWALSGALRPYSIVHFATHAEINDDLPGSSKIILSSFDAHGQEIPSDLRLTDIYTLELSADLVVLSACQSALGQRIEGNGLVGLARGFFYAGAGRLVVSLWDVDDEATATLMIEFYRALTQDDATPAEALRHAQEYLRTRTHWVHPYFWAGFIVQGPGW